MAQLRANGFSEAEYPYSFLDSKKDLDLLEEAKYMEKRSMKMILSNQRNKTPQSSFCFHFLNSWAQAHFNEISCFAKY